jgi:radical SAM superfamily enzyme YgiQ (UPF0313 family)
MAEPHILVVSPFEGEMQPLAGGCAAAALEDRGATVIGWDAEIYPDAPLPEPVGLILVSVQQFEGVERGLALAERLRTEAPNVLLMAFGQHAQINSSTFLDVMDAVVMNEPERIAEELVDLAAGRRSLKEVPALRTKHGRSKPPARGRLGVSLPARRLFPALVHYPAHHTKYGLLGNIEVTRGCRHRCTYCSVYSAYDGHVAAYQSDVVIGDALQLAEQGVRHFCFIDAEFFNSQTLGSRAMRRIANELGSCTFEITTRVDHIIANAGLLEELAEVGLRRVTSALEFPSDNILRIFDKGIDVADMRRAIDTASQIGLELNPTFIPFTPWVTYEELMGFEDFLVETGLARVVHPTALQTRLLLYKGSPLLSSPWLADIETVDRGLWLEWRHPDPRVDELWEERRAEAEEEGHGRCCVRC